VPSQAVELPPPRAGPPPPPPRAVDLGIPNHEPPSYTLEDNGLERERRPYFSPQPSIDGKSSTPPPPDIHHDLTNHDLVSMFDTNPLSLLYNNTQSRELQFTRTGLKWHIVSLDVSPPTTSHQVLGEATVVVEYTQEGMAEVLQASDIAHSAVDADQYFGRADSDTYPDVDIISMCVQFSTDPVEWFARARHMKLVHPEWGREWEGYSVCALRYSEREEDVRVGLRRRVDARNVRAWLGVSRRG
jgi:hypothetical protein